jgi:hypothetical protein
MLRYRSPPKKRCEACCVLSGRHTPRSIVVSCNYIPCVLAQCRSLGVCRRGNSHAHIRPHPYYSAGSANQRTFTQVVHLPTTRLIKVSFDSN